MDREEVSGIIKALLKCELVGGELDSGVKNKLTPDILMQVYSLSKKHDVAHIVGDTLIRNKVELSAEVKGAFLKQQSLAVFRYERLKYELNALCEFFEQNEIPYMPLKGSVIRAYYPRPEMRTSCDIDILVKKQDVKKATKLLIEQKGYKKHSEDSHDISLFSPSNTHLELHFRLKDEDDGITAKADKFFASVWERSTAKGYRYEMEREVFVAYMLFHMAKHFILGGCGVRSVVDLWIIESQMGYDEDKLDKTLKECGIEEFGYSAITLSRSWFGDCEQTNIVKEMEKYIFNGSIYGGLENKIALASTKKSKFKYILGRVFPTYNELCCSYPSLKKCPVLFPFYQVRRWFGLLFKKGIKKSVKKANVEISAFNSATKDTQNAIVEMFRDFEFSETGKKKIQK